ncbi:CobW family GTP-binding protein [uncultured Desulfobacter sp.]|uniref:CobW family GTP-binding protein n=1 Tax=uncultured Desulfobacter sp. TaxID=240139 RepID=UPI0029F577EE|nr:CobW family GTP-binding protein [uncultured Desulfobacter sp.]
MLETDPACGLDTLLPPSVVNAPELVGYELARAVLIRSTYIPGIRHRLGWSGIHEAVTSGLPPGSLTAKVNDMPGVFSFFPVDPGPGHTARFLLSYYPAPQEPLVEKYSIEAGILAMGPDYMEKVRNFVDHIDFAGLFHIGLIECLKSDHGIFISFQALHRLGWIAENGIEIVNENGPFQAVNPGDIDQDLPAFDMGMAFFRPFAASFSYTLGAAPSCFYSQKRKKEDAARGLLETDEQRLTLGYFSNGEKAGVADWEDSLSHITWSESMPFPHPYENELWWTPNLTGTGKSLDKKAVDSMTKPRFILLTGFLGTGKTSFLDHFIQAQTAANNFVAVIQNEIGEKGLDAALLDQTYAVTQMDEGCVCCTLAGNLRAALTDILDRYRPDFIVLETTGLANPANILSELQDLDDLFEFGSVTTLVDGSEGQRILDRFEVARDQVRLADVILINKCDLPGADLEGIEKQINKLNPVAVVHKTVHAAVHPGVLYGVNFRNPLRRPLFYMPGTHATHEDDQIETRLVTLDHSIDEAALNAVIKGGGEQILRVKGIVRFKDQPGPMVFQYAPGTWQITPFTGEETDDYFLVFIGLNLEQHLSTKGVFA